ncbi:MAG: hypothetical protein QGF59_08020 [Pirellulaceae bacterium]|nr:hypothetical protein [Pirellulaceae bacterium]
MFRYEGITTWSWRNWPVAKWVGMIWGVESENDNPKRWRLQLRLSTALLLVALSAVVCAWVTDHRLRRQAAV